MVTISGSTRVVGVVGSPVRHTLSPPMHAAAIEALGLDWVYVPFEVAPERLAAAVAGAKALGLVGLNVTLPHKQAMAPLMDRIDPAAEAIGAVNTVHFAEEGAVGYNTDAWGFTRTVEVEGDFDFKGESVLMVGAGGAGRAMCVGAIEAGAARLAILNRNANKARALAAELAVHWPEADIHAVDPEPAAIARAMGRAHLIANATSLGMKEDDPLPVPTEELGEGQIVFDAVYTPLETPLLRDAAARNARAVGGLGMLVRQGARSLAIWSGREPDEGIMTAALKQRLGLA